VHFQFALEAAIVETARLAHERQRRGAQHLGRLLAADARRSRQTESVGDEIIPIAHVQFRVIAGVHDTVGPAPLQRGEANSGKIVGVNVVGVHVLLFSQGGQAATQPFERQAVGSIDSRNAKDGNAATGRAAEVAQLPFRIETPLAARTFRSSRLGFIDTTAAAIAVHPAGTEVHEVTW
jgi:hypothetical protein